ncbi:hypothetical protein PLESTM_000707700 [Pleodorina starrii]|nr:hypothetical protein PLESTM_000707700 [Pleodorina starrii]
MGALMARCVRSGGSGVPPPDDASSSPPPQLPSGSAPNRSLPQQSGRNNQTPGSPQQSPPAVQSQPAAAGISDDQQPAAPAHQPLSLPPQSPPLALASNPCNNPSDEPPPSLLPSPNGRRTWAQLARDCLTNTTDWLEKLSGVLPSPGSQAVSGLLAVLKTIEGVADNKDNLQTLTKRAAVFMALIETYHTSLETIKYKHIITDFTRFLQEFDKYAKSFGNRNIVMRFITTATDKAQFEALKDKFNSLHCALLLAVVADTHSLVVGQGRSILNGQEQAKQDILKALDELNMETKYKAGAYVELLCMYAWAG